MGRYDGDDYYNYIKHANGSIRAPRAHAHTHKLTRAQTFFVYELTTLGPFYPLPTLTSPRGRAFARACAFPLGQTRYLPENIHASVRVTLSAAREVINSALARDVGGVDDLPPSPPLRTPTVRSSSAADRRFAII